MAKTPQNSRSSLGDLSIECFLTERSFWYPNFIESSAWIDYSPFAFWLMGAVRPRNFVELGTHRGYSFFAFCQTVKAMGLDTQCYAVDTWDGDVHAGFYGEEIFENVSTHLEKNYAEIARMVRSTFDGALSEFPDGSIDLLHIDGRHFYDDVKHDFESWCPKLSPRAVVLFHDTNVTERDFGVIRLWGELQEQGYPSFEFGHGRGLGVLGYGPELPPDLDAFFKASRDENVANAVREAYSRLGGAIRADRANAMEIKRLREQERRPRGSRQTSSPGLKDKRKKREPKLRKSKSTLSREITKPFRKLRRRLVGPPSKHASSGWLEVIKSRVNIAVGLTRPHDEAWASAREAAKDASRMRDWKAAAQRWQALLDDFPHQASGKTFVRLAQAQRELAELAEAEATISRGTAIFPRHPRLILETAECAISRKDWEKAVALFESIAEKKLSLPTVSKGIVGALFRMLEAGQAELVSNYHTRAKPRLEQRYSLALDGILLLRSGNWAGAQEVWAQYWNKAVAGDFVVARSSIPIFNDMSRQNRFATLKPKNMRPYGALRQSICVYTALFGDYDALRPPAYLPEGIDFVCFSDRPRQVSGWKVIICDPGMGSPTLNNRRLKILPFDELSDYDASLYVDANTLFLGDPMLLCQRWLEGSSFAAWSHPERDDLYSECEAVLASCRHEPSAVIELYRKLKEESYPPHDGLVEASFLWRVHDREEVKEFCQKWWATLQAFPKRDQLCFPYAIRETGISFDVFPRKLGTARANMFFVKLPHVESPIENLRRIEASQGKTDHEVESKERHGAPTAKLSRVSAISDLVFVYHAKHQDVASTVMRSKQLCEIARRSLNAPWNAHYVSDEQLHEIKNSVVILSKGYCQEALPETIEQARRRDNIVCADYVDAPVDTEIASTIDLMISSSVGQYESLLKGNYKSTLITHHVDPGIADITAQTDYLSFGYYGEMANVKHAADLMGHVDFCHLNTKTTGPVWIDRLRHANVHYAVRQPRAIDGFKPFLKGFTAAHCGANILVNRQEGDAVHYLTTDYPYLLEDTSLKSVLGMIEKIRESFGSREWFEGLEIMKSVRVRSSDEQVGREISALLELVVG
jgi:hypothetical protein